MNQTLIRQFYESLLKLINNRVRASITEGEITNVDESKYTCTVRINGVLYYNVPFGVTTVNKCDVVEIPDKGNCIIVFKELNAQRPLIIKAEKIKKVIYYPDTVIPGNNLVDKINDIEKDINTLKTIFAAWTPLVEAPLKASMATWMASTLQLTHKENLEI